jgi:ATP-dependent helicase/nuclease subunit A
VNSGNPLDLADSSISLLKTATLRENNDTDAPQYLKGLNAQQQDAVMTPPDVPLQVLAGAGTGKTELISRRFVKLVQDFQAQGITRPEERILVVTFTSDAAAAMRERIHQRLLDNSHNYGENNEQELVPGRSAEGLGPDAWISTFHQFCMRLLRAHPLEVGLPPDFVIFNPLQQEVLFKRVIQAILLGEHADLKALFQKGGLAETLPADVLSLDCLQRIDLKNIESLLDADRCFRLVNRIKTAGLSPGEFHETAIRQSERLSQRVASMPTPHDKDLKSLDNIQLKIEAWQDALRPWSAPNWNPLQDAEEKADRAGKKVTASVYKDELPGLAKLYLAPRTYEPLMPDPTLFDTALAHEKCVIDILTAIYALYQEALLAQGACDFDDLINHSIQLLIRHPGLRTRYQRQFEAIVVDEFQDSNGSQLRLLELLVRDGARNLTVVGDEKQSIYAFRFAQPENLDLIFRNALSEVPETPHQKKVTLQINYRSRPPILAVANQLTDAMTGQPGQRLQAPETNIPTGEELNITLEGPLEISKAVTWVNWDGLVENEAGKLVHQPIQEQKDREAQFIALEIARLVREEGRRFSEIAILVKSHIKAEMIQRDLTALSIPSVRQKNLGFFQEPVIKDAMALLRLMGNLGDELSLVRILQNKLNQKQLRDLIHWKRALSPSGNAAGSATRSDGHTVSLFDACLLLKESPDALAGLPSRVAQAVGDLAFQLWTVRKAKARLTPAQLFLALAKAVGLIDSSLPEWRQKQQRISLRTFEKLLHLFSQRRPLQPTLDEVIETLEHYASDSSLELPVSEALSGEDAVQIMTIYAAKGLEFPVVFVAYTEVSRVSRGGDDTALLFDPQYEGKNGFGLILGKINGQTNVKRELYQKCWVNPRAEREAQRVFYVALTRAREYLYVLRGSQSFPWTDPDAYPSSAMRVISETRNAALLESLYWQADREALRQEMAAIQESRKSRIRGEIGFD